MSLLLLSDEIFLKRVSTYFMFPSNLSLRHKFVNKVFDVARVVNNDFKSEKLCCDLLSRKTVLILLSRACLLCPGRGREKYIEEVFFRVALKRFARRLKKYFSTK